jgi:hypothetical protein
VLLLASTLEYTITVMVWCCDVAVTTALKEERASLQNLPTLQFLMGLACVSEFCAPWEFNWFCRLEPTRYRCCTALRYSCLRVASRVIAWRYISCLCYFVLLIHIWSGSIYLSLNFTMRVRCRISVRRSLEDRWNMEEWIWMTDDLCPQHAAQKDVLLKTSSTYFHHPFTGKRPWC